MHHCNHCLCLHITFSVFLPAFSSLLRILILGVWAHPNSGWTLVEALNYTHKDSLCKYSHIHRFYVDIPFGRPPFTHYNEAISLWWKVSMWECQRKKSDPEFSMTSSRGCRAIHPRAAFPTFKTGSVHREVLAWELAILPQTHTHQSGLWCAISL